MTARRTRSDAVRSRAAILAAAQRLFDETDDGPCLSTEEIAVAAGVGKGTIFRAFGDRAGLLRAVYDTHTEALRAALPVDDASPSPEQVHTLLQAIVAAKIKHRQLVLALEDATGRRKNETLYDSPHYRSIHRVLENLLAPLLTAPVSPAWTAHILLSAVRADLLEHLLAEAMTEQEILDEVRTLVDRVLGGPKIS